MPDGEVVGLHVEFHPYGASPGLGRIDAGGLSIGRKESLAFADRHPADLAVIGEVRGDPDP